jgi:hypothetical protein
MRLVQRDAALLHLVLHPGLATDLLLQQIRFSEEVHLLVSAHTLRLRSLSGLPFEAKQEDNPSLHDGLFNLASQP